MDHNRLPDEAPPLADGDDWIAIGEAVSAEEAHWASVTLFELGIECELAFGNSEVDEIRRAVEGWTNAQRLLVKPEDAPRAIAAVQSKLVPVQYWSSAELYLQQRPTEDVLKILDYPNTWSVPLLATAKRVLAMRDISYPPHGATSLVLPFCCLLLGIWLGPFAGIAIRWRIDKMDSTNNGGTRPHYADITRGRANKLLLVGFALWCCIVLVTLGSRLWK
jgi:hypothetical protein